MEDMLDDIREQGDQLTQIQDAMRQPLGYVQDVDEADLEAELEVGLPGSSSGPTAAVVPCLSALLVARAPARGPSLRQLLMPCPGKACR